MRAVTNWHVKMRGKMIEPGTTITISDEEAANLGPAVTPIAGKTSAAARPPVIVSDDSATPAAPPPVVDDSATMPAPATGE